LTIAQLHQSVAKTYKKKRKRTK